MNEKDVSDLLVGKDDKWVKRKLKLTNEEWDYLGVLAYRWFGKHRRKKWAIARLCDEIRVLFTAPPTDRIKGRVLEIREKDLDLLLVLKKLFEIDHTSGALRSLLYMIEDAPEPMFVHLSTDIANYPNKFDGLWIRKILDKLKGKEISKLRSHWYSNKQLKKPIGRCQVRRLLAHATIEREK